MPIDLPKAERNGLFLLDCLESFLTALFRNRERIFLLTWNGSCHTLALLQRFHHSGMVSY